MRDEKTEPSRDGDGSSRRAVLAGLLAAMAAALVPLASRAQVENPVLEQLRVARKQGEELMKQLERPGGPVDLEQLRRTRKEFEDLLRELSATA